MTCYLVSSLCELWWHKLTICCILISAGLVTKPFCTICEIKSNPLLTSFLPASFLSNNCVIWNITISQFINCLLAVSVSSYRFSYVAACTSPMLSWHLSANKSAVSVPNLITSLLIGVSFKSNSLINLTVAMRILNESSSMLSNCLFSYSSYSSALPQPSSSSSSFMSSFASSF